MTYQQAPDVCDECTQPVSEDDAAPTCGAHRLHQGCAAWFRPCRDCTAIWEELEWRPDVAESVRRLTVRIPPDPLRGGAEAEADPWGPLAEAGRRRVEGWWRGWKGRAPGSATEEEDA